MSQPDYPCLYCGEPVSQHEFAWKPEGAWDNNELTIVCPHCGQKLTIHRQYATVYMIGKPQ